jgi:hypothetical protein
MLYVYLFLSSISSLIDWLIGYLVINANFSSISALSLIGWLFDA